MKIVLIVMKTFYFLYKTVLPQFCSVNNNNRSSGGSFGGGFLNKYRPMVLDQRMFISYLSNHVDACDGKVLGSSHLPGIDDFLPGFQISNMAKNKNAG